MQIPPEGKNCTLRSIKSSSSFEHLINILYAMEMETGRWMGSMLRNSAKPDGKLLGGFLVYKVYSGEYVVGLTFEEGGAKYVADGAPVSWSIWRRRHFKPDGVYIIKNAKNMKNAKGFIDFVTSKEAQTIIVQQLNRRSVRKDVPAPDYMTAKEDMNIIFDEEAVVVEKKQEWIDRFLEIFTGI